MLTADKSGHGEDKTEVDRTFHPVVTVVAGALCGLMPFKDLRRVQIQFEFV